MNKFRWSQLLFKETVCVTPLFSFVITQTQDNSMLLLFLTLLLGSVK